MQLTLTLGKLANSRLAGTSRAIRSACLLGAYSVAQKDVDIHLSRKVRPTPNIIVITRTWLAWFIKFGTLSSLGGVGVGFR